MPNPKTTKPYRALVVNMTTDEHLNIAEMAKAEMRSKSQLARMLLSEAIAARHASTNNVEQADV